VDRAIAKKLLVYATGRPLGMADRVMADQVVASAQAQQLGFKSMIHAVVDSDLFLEP
jgi:hypothetical protein